MTVERKDAVTLKGKPLTLVGPEIKVGAKMPDFQAVANDMSEVTLKTTGGKVRIFASVPSLDTPVCDAETRRFNQEATGLPGVEVLTISCDLPFAQKRWCAAAGLDRVKTLSDHRDTSFGAGTGTLIKELRILSRAVFVVDRDDVVRHVEYVKEVAEQPKFEAAVQAARRLIS